MPNLYRFADNYIPASRRPSKLFFLKGVMIFVVGIIIFQLVGGIWDRVLLQTEMMMIRTNLNKLQKTMTTIDTTYDNLNSEILALVDVAFKRLPSFKSLSPDETVSRVIKKKSLRTCNDHEGRANLIKNALDEIEAKNKKPELHSVKESHSVKSSLINLFCLNNITRDASAQRTAHVAEKSTAMHKNAGTIARYPLASKGAGSFQLPNKRHFTRSYWID